MANPGQTALYFFASELDARIHYESLGFGEATAFCISLSLPRFVKECITITPMQSYFSPVLSKSSHSSTRWNYIGDFVFQTAKSVNLTAPRIVQQMQMTQELLVQLVVQILTASQP